jgi:hypothetical protein
MSLMDAPQQPRRRCECGETIWRRGWVCLPCAQWTRKVQNYRYQQRLAALKCARIGGAKGAQTPLAPVHDAPDRSRTRMTFTDSLTPDFRFAFAAGAR